jgi:cation:H+ antiporter
MEHSLLEWIGNEELLNHLVAGFPTWGLLVAMAVCIYILSKGADYMIDGAASLAMRTGMPRIVIGATIISLGTTMPEMFVSVLAAWTGNPGLALGNGVGSIICDTGLIFGLMCLLTRVPVKRYILNRTGWVQVGSATLLVAVSLIAYFTSDGNPVLGRGVGLLFLALLAGYLYMAYRWARTGGTDEEEEEDDLDWGVGKSLLFTFLGLIGVIVSSRVLVPCAAEGAARIGVPQDIIAATLVAFGTSLPELMTAITAVRKGHPQIMVGNVVGADVLNCLFVIGAAAFARPLEVPANFFNFHFPAMLIILYSFRFFIFMNKDGWFKRWQGGWILGVYVIYLILQYAFNMGHSRWQPEYCT